jgi:hypothetical protein
VRLERAPTRHYTQNPRSGNVSPTPDFFVPKNGVPAQPVKLDVSRKLACDNVAAVLQGGELLTPVA